MNAACMQCGTERPKENRFFCSMSCRDKKERPAIAHVCLVCEKPFTAKVKHARYCSARCRGYGAKLDVRGFLRHLLKHRKRHVTIQLDALYAMYGRQQGECAVSGAAMTHSTGAGRCYTNISLDRINAGGPYVIENVRLVCLAVNLMRLDMADEELVGWCKKIAAAQQNKGMD
jgi:hypothetical protein